MKLVKKYLDGQTIERVDYTGPFSAELTLTKDPMPETNLVDRLPDNMRYKGNLSRSLVPQLRSDLPADHPINVRNAIALAKGWVEVPISEINIEVNKKWIPSIRKAAKKYGANAKYIVDPNTGEIISENRFEEAKTELAFQNTSGQIQDNNTAFEVQLALNHRDLLRRDPLDLAKYTITAGMLTNPVGWTALGYLGQGKYLYDGYNQAYLQFKDGLYGKALANLFGTTVIGAIPYSKTLAFLKYAPKIAVPVYAAAAAADAYAGDGLDPSVLAPLLGDPQHFQSTLTPAEQQMIMNGADWEEIAKDNATRDAWIEKIRKELAAAGFSTTEGQDDLLSAAEWITGNKGVEQIPTTRQLQADELKSTLTDMGIRYGGPAVGAGIYQGAKALWPKVADWSWGKKLLWGTYGLNVLYDLTDKALIPGYKYLFPSEGEDVPAEYNYNTAYYFALLIKAYARLNSGTKNTYAVGSSFGPYQTYPKVKNVGLPDGVQFTLPDTMHYRIERARPKEGNATLSTVDSTTKAVSEIKIDPHIINGK